MEWNYIDKNLRSTLNMNEDVVPKELRQTEHNFISDAFSDIYLQNYMDIEVSSFSRHLFHGRECRHSATEDFSQGYRFYDPDF